MKPVKLPGFTGINNRAPVDRLPKDEAGRHAVRDAVNVDLISAGTFQRRPGYTLAQAAANARSLFSDGAIAFYADGAQLYSFDGTTRSAVAALASPHAPVCFAKTPIGLAWSDGYSLNIIKDGVSSLAAPALPNPLPAVTAQAGGALKAGVYGVAFATKRADGLRSAFSAPAYATVPEGGRIRLTMPAYAVDVDVFVTACDGDTFYRDRTLPAGTSLQDLSIITSTGEPVTYEFTASLPGGTILAFNNGRLLTASGNMVRYSRPFNPGIYRPGVDYFVAADPITLIAPVDDGVYIATEKQSWFMPGGDISNSSVAQLSPIGAVPGTLATIPNSSDLMWFSARGQVRAGNGGAITLISDKSIAFTPASAGASVVRETNGLRTLITALADSRPNTAAVLGSYMDAEVITP